MNVCQKIESLKIVIATHVYATGPAQDLKEYLIRNKIPKLLFIGHPLFFDSRLRGSGFEIYEGGKCRKEKFLKIIKIPEVLSYVNAVILNIIWVFCYSRNWDLYVGSNNLNALSGVFLKKIGIVKKVIYYVIDYNPYRFKNMFLNRTYHFVDQFCVRHCDETWNLSPRMAEARKNYFNFESKKQKVVPIGVWIKCLDGEIYSKSDNHTLVFIGHITEKQGIQCVLDCIPEVLKEIPDFKFLVIGGGPYLQRLKSKTEALSIKNNVLFTGYIEKHEEIDVMLSKCSVGIALYNKFIGNNLSFTYFADPGKLKSYLASGLPVILTDVPYNAGEIQKRGCGLIVERNPNSVAKAVVELMKDEKRLRRYRENALSYVGRFDWNVIFKKNLKTVL